MTKIFLTAVLMFAPFFSLSAQYDKDVFFWRGRQSLADGKYAQAIENFNILARLDTADYQTYFFRGIAKYNLGDLRGAKKDFNTSVRINPVFTSGYHYRGITESRSGDYEAALKDMDKALSLRPGYEGLYFSRGVTYFLAQQFDKAVKDFDKYIRRQPKDPSAYLNRGASYLFLGDTLSALNDYNKAIKLDRFDAEGYVRRGRLYAGKNDLDAAIKDMNKAIEIDTTNTFAYFNRAIMLYEQKDYKSAMSDLDRVLKDEPGNALTLYNRGLIKAQLGDFESALDDLDRVLNINPGNVLAHFNRAAVLIELGLYRDALEDYDAAIELYPDFAKAYMNRAYVKNLLGMSRESKLDYDTARRKVAEYKSGSLDGGASLADTSARFNSLLALDADFARKDFNDELLQHRDIDVRLRPLVKFVLASSDDGEKNYTVSHIYENSLLERFRRDLPVSVKVADKVESSALPVEKIENKVYSMPSDDKRADFLKALLDSYLKQYNSALAHYDSAVGPSSSAAGSSSSVHSSAGGTVGASSAAGGLANSSSYRSPTGVDAYYEAFYRMNRGVLRAEMIDFISSIESNVQTLSMDDSGSVRARVRDQVIRQYDYSEAIEDLQAAADILPDFPYIHYDLGNLYTLSSELVRAIESYTKAINLYPYMGNAYFNRGLVQIYLKDKEKGCLDLSRAGELGVSDAYSVINRFCEDEQ